MGAVKPLKIVNGMIQQMGSSDYIEGLESSNNISQTNGNASAAMVMGEAVYLASADTVLPAQANASGTSYVVGLIADASIAHGVTGGVMTAGVLVATVAQWDAVITGGSTGLTPGSAYFLDPSTAGNITATAPTTGGQYVVFIGLALSTTELKIMTQPPIGL